MASTLRNGRLTVLGLLPRFRSPCVTRFFGVQLMERVKRISCRSIGRAADRNIVHYRNGSSEAPVCCAYTDDARANGDFDHRQCVHGDVADAPCRGVPTKQGIVCDDQRRKRAQGLDWMAPDPDNERPMRQRAALRASTTTVIGLRGYPPRGRLRGWSHSASRSMRNVASLRGCAALK